MRNCSYMPSLSMTLLAVLIGVALSYLLHLLDLYYQAYSFETVTWAFINKLGWWWFGIPVVVSAFGLYYVARLDRPQSVFGFVTRMMTLTAFIMYLGCWQNTGLGPIAAVLSVTAQVMLIRQLALGCAARRDRPSYSDEPFMMRLYASLTTELDDIKKSS